MAGPPDASDTMKIMYNGGPILNIISLTFSIIPLLLLIFLFIYKRSMVNRTSLRLQGGVAFIDFTNHLCTLFFITTPPGDVCNFIGFWRVFGREMYCFLNIAIALNLQLVFLMNRKFDVRWEYFYWGVSVTLALICSIPPAGLGYYGKAKNLFCQFDKTVPPQTSMYLGFFLVALPMIIAAIYCLVIAVLVILKLRNNITSINYSSNSIASVSDRGKADSTGLQNFLKKLILRVALYPLVCFVCLSGVAIQSLASLAGDKTEWLAVWAAFGSELIGTFNCIAFLLDPTLHKALYASHKSLKSKFFPGSKENQNYDIELDSNSESNMLNDTEASTNQLILESKHL